MRTVADAVSPGATLTLRNRQRDCRIDGAQLRRLVRHHLEAQLGLSQYEVSIHLLPARRMAEANQRHLQHEGPTDVITFDYREPDQDALQGELLVCPAVARAQARDYGTSWDSEILRYIIHGLLHLRGYDDRTPADRRVMKREEDRLLKALCRAHPARVLCRRRRPRKAAA